MDDLQKQRLVENEEAFREINERITMDVQRDRLDAVIQVAICECSDEKCVERVHVTPSEYRFVRSKPRRFLIAPRQDTPEIERVVYRHDRYWVVEKM